MSNTPETDLDLELHFLPAWAKQAPDANRYAHYKGETARPDDRRDDRRGPPRRREQGGGRGPGGPRGPRPAAGGSRPEQRGDDRRGRNDRQPGPDRDRRDLPRRAPEPTLELNVAFTPDDKGVDSLARQIRMTGRAYPLFDIAQMILAKPERHTVTISVCKKPDGAIIQPLFMCALDDSLWLSEDEAVHYVLDKHFTTFYQPERTQIDAPKGTYTFVAQCGLSGVIFGPPNHHDYQNQLHKLHSERFARMPFDAFKARVKIVRDEAVVKKWVEDQSWRTEYVCLNLPEPLRLGSREEVEKHFRQAHLANIIKPVETFRLGGAASRNLRSPALMRLIRSAWEDQKRFPLQIATVLSQQFAAHGLQFFKVNRTVTHVAVARPHYLDVDASPVSEGVKRIVNFINANAKCTHRQMLDALAPMPAPAASGAPAGGEGEAVSAPAESADSPERTAVRSDLHWLVHQGHVIEFANGLLETAKKPLPKPEKPVVAKPPPGAAATGATTETAPVEVTAEAMGEPVAASPSPVESGAGDEPSPENAPESTAPASPS